MCVYILLTWCFQIRRAIKLEVKLINSKTKKSETQIHETSQEKEKTIKVVLKVERRLSVFALLARIFLRQRKVYLKVSSDSTDFILTPKNKKKLTEITEEIDGFSIDITDQIFKSLLIKVGFESEKSYDFVFNTRRGIEITPERKVLVYTNLFLGEKRVGFVFKSLFEIHDGTHTVEIFP